MAVFKSPPLNLVFLEKHAYYPCSALFLIHYWKNIMYKLVISTGLLLLAGCATTQSFNSTMDDFKGQPASQLIDEFGTPDQRIEQHEQTILVFRPMRVNIPVPTAALVSGMGGAYITPRSSSNFSIRAACQVVFTLRNDQVTDWYSHGKDCPGH